MKKLPEHYIKMLHFLMDQWVNCELAEYDLTSAQSHIVGYLTYHEGPPCARDLERFFGLSHPTVSGLLRRMESKGFIEIRQDSADRRVKRIFLTEKGCDCSKRIRSNALETESRMVTGFSEDEKELFLSFLQRAVDNMCDKTEKCCEREELTHD